MTKCLNIGGRRAGETRRLKIQTVLNPEIRIVSMKHVMGDVPPIVPSYGRSNWVEKMFCDPRGAEREISSKVIWFGDDGYHEADARTEGKKK